MSKKPHRVIWQVLPQQGLFRWKLVRDGEFVRSFWLQGWAIDEARAFMVYDWDAKRLPSELLIHNRRGQIRDKDTYPRSSDPPDSKG